MSRPDVLYFGSRELVSVLEPGARASHDRHLVLPWALALCPDERGHCHWSLHGPENPRISIERGWLDTTGVGYIYRLANTDQFEQVAQHQWLLHAPVTPLDYEIIRSSDYVDRIDQPKTAPP